MTKDSGNKGGKGGDSGDRKVGLNREERKQNRETITRPIRETQPPPTERPPKK